jgi:hypothetical protein
MAINLDKEPLITLVVGAKLLPPSRQERPVHVSFLIREIHKGNLEAVRVGSRWATSVEAIERWLRRQTERALAEKGTQFSPGGTASAAPGRTTSAQRREHSRVSAKLDRIGIRRWSDPD